MPDVTVKRLEDFEANHDFFFRVRYGLGVTSFGMQVEKIPPHFDGAPTEHDHAADGQEEVYTPIQGTATLVVAGEEHVLAPGTFARVGPGERRRVVTGEEGVVLLCLGGTPGRAYVPPPFTEEAAPWTAE